MKTPSNNQTRIMVEPSVGYNGRREIDGSYNWWDLTDKPLNTVLGSAPQRIRGITVNMTTRSENATSDKPPFTLPTMAEVKTASDQAKLTMIGTFSGCGGSSIGYTLAGFKILLANEFDPAASDVYKANMPWTTIDHRSITDIQSQELLDRLGLEKGELDLLEGSPPCSKFSLAGTRDKGWNKVTNADSAIKQANVEDLFFEWIRLVDGLQPRTICSENVVGLRTGKAKGYFKNIVEGLRQCGYRVHVYELDSQWLGVPQARRRLFFTGVRNDLSVDRIEPPKPFPYRYTILDALPHLASTTTWHSWYGKDNIHRPIEAAIEPAPTIMRGSAGGVAFGQIVLANAGDDTESKLPSVNVHDPKAWDGEPRRLTIPEVQRLSSFPDDFDLGTTNYSTQWGRLGNAVPPLLAKAIATQIAAALNADRSER